MTGQTTESKLPPLDRYFWLAMFIAAICIIPRSILITSAHSPSTDDEYQLRRGLHYLTNTPKNLFMPSVDGPLAEAIDALPMLWSGSTMAEPIHPANMPDRGASAVSINHTRAQIFATEARPHVLFGHALSPDALLMRIAIFKAILFIPFLGIVFQWVRYLYGINSACTAIAMFVIDPSFASHIPVAAIDVLSLEAVIIACYSLWLWVRQPSPWRMCIAVFFTAVALLTKQTAIVMPLIAIGYMAIGGLRRINLRSWLNRLAGFFFCFFFVVWALTKFDFSRPSDHIDQVPPSHGALSIILHVLSPLWQQRWPAGQYIAATVNSLILNHWGRWAYLFGTARVGGWWYYYFGLLGLKAPLGFLLIILLSIYSLKLRKPFFAEWSLLLPAIILGVFLLTSRIDIGIRHFLPEYALLLLLASRCAGVSAGMGRRVINGLIVLALGSTAISAASYHPDYLSYINFPYHHPWLVMNDSNIDWGQGLKETSHWLDDHPHGKRPVYLRYDWDSYCVPYYLGQKVKRLTQFDAPPRTGLLIICPLWVAGYLDSSDTYGFLRSNEPTAIIGHCMLVYDLDQIPHPGTQLR